MAHFSDIKSELAVLHHRHGSNIRLSEDNTRAHRKNPIDDHWHGVVMTASPVPVGKMFQVTLLMKLEGKELFGSLVSVVYK